MKALSLLLIGIIPTTFLVIIWVFTLGSFNIITAIHSDANLATTGLFTVVAVAMVITEIAATSTNVSKPKT